MAFCYFQMKIYILGTHWNCLAETVSLSTRKICFDAKVTKLIPNYHLSGVVGCGGGVLYLTSLGCPTDIGLQLGKACYSCSR